MSAAEQAASAVELLDIVDPVTGEPTGVQLGKATIHAEGLPHRDVHVWLTDGEYFVEQQRRWDKKIMPGAWDISVGGHVGAGESYLDAAIRETGEELGLALPPERFIAASKLAVEMVMQPGPNQWTHRTVGDNFVVVERNLSIGQLTLQESEVLDARMYAIDQLEVDLQHPETALWHAPQPLELWQLGIAAMRNAVELS